MPNYVYRCQECGIEAEKWRSIHAQTVRSMVCPACQGRAVLVIQSPAIAAAALPNKMHGVRAADQKEKEWQRDMPAYYRLRKEGLQPKSIDGSGDLEARADSATEIEMGRAIPKDKLRMAEQAASEFLGRDVTEEGKKIGKAKREVEA